MSHDPRSPLGLQIDDTADVSPEAVIGRGTRVWNLAQIRERARLGEGCVIGRGAYVGPGVAIGNNVKIQNYALIYEPAELGDGAFVGPAAILTNDQHPRAVNPDGSPKSSSDWVPVGVSVREGASIGAGAICVAPVTIGRWAMVAAGALVNRDVPAHALVAGVPAQRTGWVGRAGLRLVHGQQSGIWLCPRTGSSYRQTSAEVLEELP